MKRRFLLLAAFAALTVCSYAQNVKCDLVNDGARRFMEEVDYAGDPEYAVSFARKYRKDFGATDRPKPVTVSWTEAGASRVRVSASPAFENAVEVTTDTTFAEIYNLNPGVKYFYEVLDGNGKVLGEAYIGSRNYDAWASIIEGYLK